MSLQGINPGRFDILLTIEQPTYTRNGNGEEVISSWATVKTCRAMRNMRPGVEADSVNQQVHTITREYRIRHDSTITPQMRVSELNDTRYYYIRDVQHFYRERYSLIVADGRDN